MAKSKGKDKGGGAGAVCGGCKNFRPGTSGHGRCARKDKKREATDKACGHFDARKT